MPTGSLQVASSSSSDEGPSSSDSEAEQKYDNFSENIKPTLAIRKDGMAVCELCGNVGVKHAFYSKSKRYCSLACSRASASSITTNTTVPAKSFSCQVKASLKRPIMVAPPLKKKHCSGFSFPRKSKHDVAGSFDWKLYFSKPEFAAAPVSCFKHVALSDVWDNITIGMKVEVENTDCENLTKLFPSFYWIASVVKIAGFYALLRYEGFEQDGSKDFWVNLCIDAIHPVGWCASQGKPLIPPKSIEHKYVDWKDFLVKRLTGARTFPANFCQKVEESFQSRFRPDMRLEVVDKNRISAVRVARVAEVVGGRLHLSYESSEEDDFWCHEQSPLIHPVGWAQVVGHDLRASPEYARESLQKTLLKNFDPNDASWDFFPPMKSGPTDLRFKEGMKLEAIDPLNLSTICVATVTRVLRSNYLMIGIDGMMAANGSDWFCYHATSPCIFPVGFCELNNIELTPPRGHKGEFHWFEYLKDTNSVAAPVSLFKKDIPNHGFKPGMCVEAVDLMEPRLICVGSISQVVGRLLRLHFDGWDSSYDQWCDCESPDLFPVGWCQAVGYKLESPRLQDGGGCKKKKKNPAYRGQRKKKKRSLGLYGHKKILKHGSSENIEAFRSKSDDSVSSSSESGAAPRSPLSTQLSVTNGTAKKLMAVNF